MDDGPQPVIGWKSLVGFAGWLMVMTGTFTIILGCSNLSSHPCSLFLTEESLIIASAGASLLLARWIVWGDEYKTRVESTPGSRLRKLLLYVLLSPLIAIALAISIILRGG